MITRLAVSLAVVAASAFVSQAARAQATGYATQAEYEAAVGASLFAIDFNGSTGTVVAGSSFSSEVSFRSPESTDPATVIWSSDAITDTGSTVTLNNVSNLAGVFTTPVQAFAFDYLSGTLEAVELYDASNALIGVVPASPGGFFGATSTVPVKSFSLVHLFFSPGNRDRLFIDNFRADVRLLTVGELHEAVCALIEGLDPATDMTHPSRAVNENRKNALENRCEAVGHALDACDLEDAIDQLLSIRDKADEDGVNDWIQGDAAEALVNAIDALVEAILDHVCE